jgi:hypothetical protein
MKECHFTMLQIAMYVKCLVRSASSEILCLVLDRLYICLFDLHLHFVRHDQKSEPILLRRRRRRVGLSKYGVIISGRYMGRLYIAHLWNLLVLHVLLARIVQCQNFELREAYVLDFEVAIA